MKTFITGSYILLFWFLLSGHTEPLLMTLGVLSTLLTIYLSHRMKLIDHESHPFHLSTRFFRYCVFLGKEITLANVDVIRRILRPGTISPQVFTIPVSKKASLSKVMYANSITLTPGTVTLELKNDQLKIHALSKEAAEDLKTGRMAEQVPDEGDIV
ncbi:MAG: Na+/H+ antiporter subunit E [Pseudomonadota bacterium]